MELLLWMMYLMLNMTNFRINTRTTLLSLHNQLKLGHLQDHYQIPLLVQEQQEVGCH